MEAVPKLAFIRFELKVSPENTHFGPKLKQYIAEAYREDPESYGNEVHQLEGLRSAAVRPTIDAAGLKALNRYFCQLRAMQSRFPMAKGQPAACTFVWKDLYANMNCSLADLRFEMACILYNIGALHTQLASSETRTSADSLKVACQHFQNAAWAFQYLGEQYPQPSGADVSSEILKLLTEICFAQAQECILDKSRQDTRKPSVIGAVATQVLNFYKNSLAILGPSTGTDNIHEIIGTKLYNNWFRYLSFKTYYIGCIVCLYQGINAEEQQKMGERVAYYQQAVDKLNEASKLAKYIEPVQATQEALTFTNDIVEGKRKAAKNENEFIYHEEVPDKDMLTDLKPVCLVKAVAINFSDPEVSGQDIFSRLVPIGAHEASSLYSEEKAKLLRHVVAQVEAKDIELTEFMSSLQLDQLDVLDEEQTVPQEVVDRCAAMNAKTDMISSLVDSMNSLAELIGDVEQALADARALVQEESQLEKEYQKAVGPRPPSLVRTELARELHKYGEAHARARDSSRVLHKAMALHVANLRLLAQPLPALRRRIPSVDDAEGLDRGTMGEMRRVLGKARDMRAQRAALLAALREALAADDVTALLLADPQLPHDQLFKRELEKHTPKVKIIEQNLSAQENIINRLTALYAAYGDSRRQLADVLRRRDATLHALITSYDSFDELLSKSAKGLEFYRKLHHNLGALLARARATCQVQREERAAATASSAPPPAPGAQTPGAQTPGAQAPGAPAPRALPAVGAAPKLKDYLPYMKNRSLARNAPPQVPAEARPTDRYPDPAGQYIDPAGRYPDPAGPTSARPAPVGSEDISRAGLPDGGPPAPPAPPGYARPPGGPTGSDSHVNKYNYSANTSFNEPEEMPSYNYSANSQPQFPESQRAPPQTWAPPQPAPPQTWAPPQPPAPGDLGAALSQMHVSAPGGEYAQTYFSVHYPPSACDVATYSRAPQNMNTDSSTHPSSQYSMNYPYSPAADDYGRPASAPDVSNYFANYSQTPQNVPSSYPSVSYAVPNSFQSYSEASNGPYPGAPDTGYDAAGCHPDANLGAYRPPEAGPDTAPGSYSGQMSYAPGGAAIGPGLAYSLPADSATYINPALAQMDALDKPIKSHAKGEALSALPISSYQNFNMSAAVDYNPERAGASARGGEGGGQPYQNHPGYTYNAYTGNYDYSYGSQNSYSHYEQQENAYPQNIHQDPSWNSAGVYTSAGAYSTVQSPSEAPQSVTFSREACCNPPYGYRTAPSQTPEGSGPAPPPGAPAAADQATVAKENVNETPINAQYCEPVPSPKGAPAPPAPPRPPGPPGPPGAQPERGGAGGGASGRGGESTEPTAFDLLSDIDFSIEQKPLMPEIKVPQISERAIVKSTTAPKAEVAKPAPEEVLERPPKRDLFSDPCLINRFTQEVKHLQKVTESLTSRTPDGLTLLDSKWKHLQDVQAKENTMRSKSIAMLRSRSAATDAVPYDDSRVRLESDPDAYINASFYKRLAPWCIPLVIAKRPDEADSEVFWKAVFENKISCIVCLLTESEMQGEAYWPTTPGGSLELGALRVTLEAARRAAHWTERRLRLRPARGAPACVTHLQVAAFPAFPAKVLCAPLVLLSDAVLRCAAAAGEAARGGGAWLHCGAGAGRSALLALLIMLMCQVRAGYLNLTETLEAGCAALCRGRDGVLTAGGSGGGPAGGGGGPAGGGGGGGPTDGGVLVDAYRSALFYAQGVLCSGSTLFNGEAVSVPSGAGALPPAPARGPVPAAAPAPAPTRAPTSAPGAPRGKFSRESFEEMRQAPGLKSGDMKDPLNFLDPLWTLKKK